MFKSSIVFGCKTIFPLSDCTYGAYPLFVSVLHVLIKEVVKYRFKWYNCSGQSIQINDMAFINIEKYIFIV